MLHAEGKLKAQYAPDHLPKTEVLLIVVEDIKINEIDDAIIFDNEEETNDNINKKEDVEEEINIDDI